MRSIIVMFCLFVSSVPFAYGGDPGFSRIWNKGVWTMPTGEKVPFESEKVPFESEKQHPAKIILRRLFIIPITPCQSATSP